MKKLLFSVLTISAISFAACKNGNNKNEHEGHDMSSMKTDTMQATATDNKDIKAVSVTYTKVDPKVSAAINEIVNQYLRIKNALASDNGGEAANGGKAMVNAIAKIDKSLFTAEQKNAFDKDEEGLKEDAEHIGKKGDDIAHQRSHFTSLSEAVYNLVRAFGAGRPLYHDHCPMAKNNEGAMWISELKEVKNPYFGSAMPDCGSVEEIIK